MTAHKTILNLIESLDGYTEEEILRDHVDVLDEIDARTFCWFRRLKYGLYTVGFHNDEREISIYLKGMKFRNHYGVYKELNEISYLCDYTPYLRFKNLPTRSLDASKAIQPKGWDLQTVVGFFKGDDWGAVCTVSLDRDRLDTLHLASSDLPTEELARLHAIIQAIAYERGEL